MTLCERPVGLVWADDVFLTISPFWYEPLEPQERLKAARAALARYPSLALLHREGGEALRALGHAPKAAEMFRRGLDCECHEQVRTQLLWGAAQVAEADSPEQKRLIEQAAELNGDLIAGAMATLALRPG